MDYKQAIEQRHSVRSFKDVKISDEDVKQLTDFIDRVNNESGMSMQLILNDKDAFGKSKLAHYGKFANADNYIAVVGPDGHKEEAGYHGERIVLEAQRMGLNTCWVGLTFKRSEIKAILYPDSKIYALIAIGYGVDQGRQHKSRAPEKIMKDYDNAPDWAKAGVEYALLAPTALNQQKFRFRMIDDNTVNATTAIGPYTRIDLGIAKLHFEIGAAPKKFKWG